MGTSTFVFFTSASELFVPLLLFGIILFVFLSAVLSSSEQQLLVLSGMSFYMERTSLWSSSDQTITDIDKVTLFYNTFRDVGRVIYNEFAGDSWAKDLEYFEDHREKYE